MHEGSRERKVQVLENSERFCCVKICRDASSKWKPLVFVSDCEILEVKETSSPLVFF